MKASAAAIGIFLAVITGWSAKANESPWGGPAMPPFLRGMIHTSATSVPPYEHEDSTLTDPHRWPQSREFAGRQFKLTILARDYDVFSIHGSMSTVRPGERLDLCYVTEWFKPGPAAGPGYSWDEQGRLCQRVWYEPDTVLFRSTRYATYPSGELLEYGTVIRKQDLTTPDSMITFTESFDRAGRLIGVGFDIRGGVRESQFWWEGQPVSKDQWNKARGALFRAVAEKKN